MGILDPLRVVFIGRADDDTPIVFFASEFDESDLHIKVGDADIQPFSLINSSFDLWQDVETNDLHIQMESPAWTGHAKGSFMEQVRGELGDG